MASDDGGPTTWGSQPGGPQTANGASFQPQTTSQQQYNQVGSGGPGNYRIAGADPVTSSASGGKGYPTYPNQPYQNSPAGTTPTTTGTPAPGYPTPQQNTSQGMYPQQQQQFGQQVLFSSKFHQLLSQPVEQFSVSHNEPRIFVLQINKGILFLKVFFSSLLPLNKS